MNPVREIPDLPSLSRLFYPTIDVGPSPELGRFTRVSAEQMPAGYRELLDHAGHMTVSMEQFHGATVDVEVLDRATDADGRHYSRKIRLRTRPMLDPKKPQRGRVVQFGIVRLNLDLLPTEAKQEVLGERTPLGRVLITHGVMMTVRLIGLWKIEPGPDLCRMLELETPTTIYGRTAMIDFEDDPAIELLEISAPLPQK
jgi:hypothetical protein